MDDHKYFDSENFDNAYAVLRETQLPEKRVEAIIKMIELVSFSKNGNKMSEEYPK